MERLLDDALVGAAFDDLRRRFCSVASAPGIDVSVRDCLFAGRRVRLRVAGRALADRVVRPFAHLCVAVNEGAHVSLTIDLWDREGEGAPAECCAAPGETTDVSLNGRFLLQVTPHTRVAFDRSRASIVGCSDGTREVGVYERGKPLARFLAEWYADVAVPVVHAGFVETGEEGVLLAGKGGSGKSTLSVACASAGLGFLGEDYTAVEFTPDGGVIGHSAYGSAFLSPGADRWCGPLTGHLIASTDDAEPKSVVLVGDVWPDRLRRSAPVRAVALCSVADVDGFDITALSKPAALLAIAPSCLLQIHGRRRNSLDTIAQLVERVPCFRLRLGPRIDALPASIGALVRLAGGRTA